MRLTFAIVLAVAIPTSGTARGDEPNRGALLAAALAAGDLAASRRDYTALRRALSDVEAMGARTEDKDVTSIWRELLGLQAAPALRGRGLGPAYRMGTLAKGNSVLIEQVFLAGQEARIAVQAFDRGTLRLEVLGSNRQSPCDPPIGFQAQCQWVPLYTQRFAIRVTNAASAATSYYLVVN